MLVTLEQAKNYLRINHTTTFKVEAEYVGTGDGILTTFTLDNTPIDGTVSIYVNNVLKAIGTDYTLNGATITFTNAPTGVITASYETVSQSEQFEGYDDDFIESLIQAATDIAERYTGLAFIEREITETHIASNPIKLFYQPVKAITRVKINGVATTDYAERLSVGRIYGRFKEYNEIEVTYIAGYGTQSEAQLAVPQAVTAVLLLIADMYENRGDRIDSQSITGLGSVSYNMPSRARELLDTIKIGAKGIG